MGSKEILLLGLGIQSPWQLVDQHLDTDKHPHELHLTVRSERGAKYACPECGALCAAHDFQDKSWRHLNFFQHHCYIHASVPQVKCPEHGVKLVAVPWARKGSAFTLLFEQVALALSGALGVLLGIGGALLLGRVSQFQIIVTPWSVVLAFGFAVLVGAFFGLHPARKAARLRPIEALRYE